MPRTNIQVVDEISEINDNCCGDVEKSKVGMVLWSFMQVLQYNENSALVALNCIATLGSGADLNK